MTLCIDLTHVAAGLKAKVNDLTQELESTRSLLEGETLRRVEFENKVQSLNEDLQFKEKLWKEVILY